MVVSNSTNPFDLIRKIYLQPLLNSGCIGFELQLSTGQILLKSQNSSGTASKHSIKFGAEAVGSLLLTSDPRRPLDQKMAEDTCQQIAPLLAWKESEWPNKLAALEILWALKAQYKNFDWIGIYRRALQDELTVSTYIGEPTEHIRIPVDQGICGAAIRENKTLNIADVQSDPRFIACSIKTKSELVVPIRNSKGEALAEIDIDSNLPHYFSSDIVKVVELAANRLSSMDGLF